MDEKELRRQLELSEQRRAQALERARIASERRAALMEKAIQANRVHVDLENNEVPEDYDPRSKFEAELRRSLKTTD